MLSLSSYTIYFYSFFSLNYLIFGTGIQNVHADHAASHLGKAQGLANMVRAVPHHSLRRAVALPRDLLAQHNVVYESVLRGSHDQPVKDVIFKVAARAKQHLDKVSFNPFYYCFN